MQCNESSKAMSSQCELVGGPEASAISSGHYMVSNLDDCSSSEEDDLPQTIVTIVKNQQKGAKIRQEWPPRFDTRKSNKKADQQPFLFTAGKKKNAAVSNKDITQLAKLFDCLSVYSEQLTTPRWNHFRGLRLSRKDRIRLNNLIWREFYTQIVRQLRPIFVKFETPTLENHLRPRSIILEGKYWKRRFDSVCLEYLRWRCYYKLRLNGRGNPPEMTDEELLEKVAGQPHESATGMCANDMMETEDLLSDLVNNLDWLLDGATTTAGGLSMLSNAGAMASSPPDGTVNNNADVMQPLLLQMTPNLEEGNDLFHILATPVSSPTPSMTSDVLSGSTAQGVSSLFHCGVDSLAGGSGSLGAGEMAMMLPPLMPTTTVSVPSMCPPGPALQSMMPPPSQAPLAELGHVAADPRTVQLLQPLPAAGHAAPTQQRHRPAPPPPPQQQQSMMSEAMAMPGPSIVVTLPPCFNATAGSPAPSDTASSCSSASDVRNQYGGPLPTRPLMAPYRKEPYPKRRKKATPVPPASRPFMAIAPKPQSAIASASVNGAAGDSVAGISLSMDATAPGSALPRRTGPLADLASPMRCDTTTAESPTLLDCQRILNNINQSLVKQRSERRRGSGSHDGRFSALSGLDDDSSSCDSSSFQGGAEEQLARAAFDFTAPAAGAGAAASVFSPASSTTSEPPQYRRYPNPATSEVRRRGSINQGLVLLHSLLPEGVCRGPGAKLIPMSKAMILVRSSEYIRKLRREQTEAEQMSEALRREVETLQKEINDCCAKLPETGLPMPPSANDTGQQWFRAYIRASTLRNWKFYIFSLMAEKLFSAYTSMVSMNNVQDFTVSVMTWLEQYCSMNSLRNYVTGALRELGTKTSILSDPSLLPQEAVSAVSEAESLNANPLPK